MRPLRQLFGYAKSYRSRFVLASFYSILNKAFDIAPEILIGVAVDTVVKKENSLIASFGFTDASSQLVVLGALTFFIWACESIFQYLYSIEWRHLAQDIQHMFRLDAYDHVQRLELDRLESLETGDVLSILNDDVNQLERFLETGFSEILQIGFSTLVISLLFFWVAPTIAVFAMLPIPVILFGTFYFQNRLADKFLDVRMKAGRLGARLANAISGIMTIKSFNAEQFEYDRLREDSNAYVLANRHAIAISSMVTPVIRIAVLAGFMATLVLGGFKTLNGTLEVGIFSALVFLTQRLLWPLTRLAEVTVMYQRSMASVTRLMRLLAIPHHPKPGNIKVDLATVRGEISFENVSFSYNRSMTVLSDFSLTIPAGSSVAFVGESGVGKSTLIKLIYRFYDPNSGRILLDDQPISQLDVTSYRRCLALVSQDVYLFSGTISENIAYGMTGVSIEAIERAAKLAQAHGFISAFQDGYDTRVGERGQLLSGGQRQRIAIARAVLRDPKILILDEATSAVDNETERAIQESLREIVKGRTTIIIAHRLSTIRNVDCICVVKNGRIVESGTHEALLAKSGLYAELWAVQAS